MADELAEAARRLARAAQRLGSESQPNAAIHHQLSASTTTTPRLLVQAADGHQRASASGATPRSPTVLSEMRSLFPHHSSSARVPSSSNPRKRKSSSKKGRVVARRFVCLADKEQSTTPDAEEHRGLLAAGLGEAKVAVPESCEEEEIRDLLLSSFSKLADAGGFELMFAESRTRELKIIPPGPSGLTMKYLVAFIGQGKIYVRPIQQDLMMSVQTNRPTLNFKPSRELCIDCDEIIEIQQLREHKAICGKNHTRPDTASKPSDVDNLDFPPAYTWEPKFNANEGEAAAASTSCIKPPSPQQGKNYKTYISIIDDDEDDDPSFLVTLEASIAESKATQNIALDTMHASIESFISANLNFEDDEDKQHIIISRKFIHNSTRAISRENFTFFKPLAVTFSGEEAVDTGGPKREYLRLLMSGIGKSSVFDGVWLSHNLELFHTKQYEIAGKLIAWSILQGGPGPRCIKPEIFNLLVGNKKNLIMSLLNIKKP
eukprot:gene8411-9311_t